jgi:hypothetical protein
VSQRVRKGAARELCTQRLRAGLNCVAPTALGGAIREEKVKSVRSSQPEINQKLAETAPRAVFGSVMAHLKVRPTKIRVKSVPTLQKSKDGAPESAKAGVQGRSTRRADALGGLRKWGFWSWGVW